MGKKKDRNAEFAKAKPSKKRVMVMTDVIKQLDRGRIIARVDNVYVRPNEPLPKSTKFSDVAKVECEVCALGGIVLSACRLGDAEGIRDEPVHRAIHPSSMRAALEAFFSTDVLLDVEHAFESSCGYSWKRVKGKERLRRIAENIVENEGAFIPKQIKGLRYAKEYGEDEPIDSSE